MNLIEFTDKGLYCAPGDFYIDPWRPVKRALITHAHGDHARWGHKYYLSHHDREIAYAKMRSGIHNLLLKGFGVDLTEEMPYHETITVFWMRTVASFLAGSNGSSLSDKVAEMVGRFDKDYPLRFYSRELLFSDEARSSFVEPDIQLFD